MGCLHTFNATTPSTIFQNFYFFSGSEKYKNSVLQFFCCKSHCQIMSMNSQMQNRLWGCQFWKSFDYTLWLINQLIAGSEKPPGWNYWFDVLTMVVLNVLLAHTLKGVPTSEAIHSLSMTPDSSACIPLSNCFNCDFPVWKLLLQMPEEFPPK